MSARHGVLVLSHGTPARREDVFGFYTSIRHGHPPTPELLDELVRRYDAIGGTSPLTARTADQVAGVAAALERRAPGAYVVESATKYVTPTIEDATARLLAAGVADVVGVVLSPLRAPTSTDQYHDRAVAAVAGRVPYHPIWSWWAAPGFVELLAGRVHDAVAACASPPTVLFTAHSLPTKVVTAKADYPAELAAAAGAVATAAGVAHPVVCWQSAGRTRDEWLGPDLLTVLRGLDAATRPEVVVCPVGFVADHLEVLYDVDVEAAALATELGLTLRRTTSLNDDPALCDLLAEVVVRAT